MKKHFLSLLIICMGCILVTSCGKKEYIYETTLENDLMEYSGDEKAINDVYQEIHFRMIDVKMDHSQRYMARVKRNARKSDKKAKEDFKTSWTDIKYTKAYCDKMIGALESKYPESETSFIMRYNFVLRRTSVADRRTIVIQTETIEYKFNK